MIIAATGHRPNKLGGYSRYIEDKLFRFAKEYLRTDKSDIVISGMALGWDQAIAKAAIEYNISLWAALPCLNQEKVWPEYQQEKYLDLLSKAVRIELVSNCEYNAAVMQKRNEWMVDNCELVVALWDGSSGGTKNCIEYARRQNKRILNLWDGWVEFK